MELSSLSYDAIARVKGGTDAPNLSGVVKFYQKPEGVLVVASVSGLPQTDPGQFFAFHIHEGPNCSGAGFPASGGHYDPTGQPHPQHAGDLPPLLSNGGSAFLAVLTDRFRVRDIIGRTVIIHSGPDDFHTQPSGNPGTKIACGEIQRF